MGTIVVSGALANKYLNGGEAWVRLSWALGLKKLGFSVYLVEQIGRNTCVDAAGRRAAFQDCENLAYFEKVVDRFGLSDSAALIYHDGEQIHGLTRSELLDVGSTADLLVNISGHLTWAPLLARLRRKVYVDLDPGFTQFWHASGDTGLRLRGHDFYFTVGENIGTPVCSIPTGQIRWLSTRPLVTLQDWPRSQEGDPNRFTTVATWRGPYGPVQSAGKTFGLKLHEFRKFIELPQRLTAHLFEMALNIHAADHKDLTLLKKQGWRIVSPTGVAADPQRFRRYVQESGAEFSVAQGIYVETQSGWFSDRTVRYLASGKPALVQDTGFSRQYPVGDGLVAFRTLDEAIAGAKQIQSNYDKHCRAARALAETYFDSDQVLGRFLEQTGVAP